MAFKIKQLTFLVFTLLLVQSVNAKVTHDFILSASGGISLGSYQAGQLYYQSLFLKENKDFATPRIITGASAGSINSFLTILNKCQDEIYTPDQSAFWKTWQDTGFQGLIPTEKETDPMALFSARVLENTAEELKQYWERGFNKGCETIFGVPVTLKTPDTLLLSTGISVQRQNIPFILKITGRGHGKPPKIENYMALNGAALQARLFLNGDDEHDFMALRNLLLASSAFPMAFPSRQIRVCVKDDPCTFENSEMKDFIDGGLYENQPLRLGHLIATHSLQKTSNEFYRHVDADGKVYPSRLSQTKDPQSFLQLGVGTLDKFITTSRTKELYTLLVQNPKISSSISNSLSYYPRASDPWGAFMGFLDVGFREFDFLLGMYESKRDVKALIPKLKQKNIRLPEETKLSTGMATWTRFQCLENYMENKTIMGFCSSPEFLNLRILAQVSLLRLYYLCHQKDIKASDWVACSALSPFKDEIPIILDIEDKNHILLGQDEDEGIYQLRLLERFHYTFDPQEFKDSTSPLKQMRQNLDTLITSLAKKQPDADEGMILQRLGKVALDYVIYQAPNSAVYAHFGELVSLGYQTNQLTPRMISSWLKLDMGLDFFRSSELFEKQSEATVAPYFGFSADINAISGPVWQYQIGLSYSRNISINENACDARSVNNDRIVCNSSLLRPSITVLFRDFIRVSLAGRYSFDGNNDGHFHEFVSVGFQRSF